jgi:hypothetical protein
MKPQLSHLWLAGVVLICAAAGISAVARAATQPNVATVDLPQRDRSNGPASPAASAAAKPPLQSSNQLWNISLEELSETRERPIFSPSRRPPSPPVVAHVPPVTHAPLKPAEPERPTVSLVGTVVGETTGIAIFMKQATRDVVRLRLGEDHQGWVLRSVDGRKATLEKNGKAVVLELPPYSATVATTGLAHSPPSLPGEPRTVQQSFAARQRR